MINEEKVREIVENILERDKGEKLQENYITDSIGIVNPRDKEAIEGFIKTTPARICVGRAGNRPTTNSFINFQIDHANAVDSVFNDVNEEILKGLNILLLKSKVESKDQHLTRPDLGRDLDEESKEILLNKCMRNPKLQIIISDGLSSRAIESNIRDVLNSLIQGLELYDIKTGTPVFVKCGRVGVMDVIGEELNAECAVMLIGERPGMVTAESMSAYITYNPRKGIQESQRVVLSNIHKGGTPPVEAGAEIASIINKAMKQKYTGIKI